MVISIGQPVTMESSTIQYFIHHLFLPPKLPQEDDYDAAKETKLLQCISEALRDFKPLVDEESENVAQRMLNTIKNLISVRDAGGILNAQRLENALQNLDDGNFPLSNSKPQATNYNQVHMFPSTSKLRTPPFLFTSLAIKLFSKLLKFPHSTSRSCPRQVELRGPFQPQLLLSNEMRLTTLLLLPRMLRLWLR